MLFYPCSETRLLNCLLSQKEGLGSIFPESKGWRGSFCFFRSMVDNACHPLVIYRLDEEALVFVPFGKPAESQIRLLTKKKIEHYLTKQLGEKPIKMQLILLVAKKYETESASWIKKHRTGASLLSVGDRKAGFILGRFKNPRLEYRLEEVGLDLDLVLQFLPPNPSQMSDEKERLFFYQRIFHRIDLGWVRGEKTLFLVDVLKEVLPFYSLYHKTERQVVLDQTARELEGAIEQYFNGFIQLQKIQKGDRTQYQLHLPEFDTKALSPKVWTKRQTKALRWLGSKTEQITIDIQPISN